MEAVQAGVSSRFGLEGIIAFCLKAGKAKVCTATATLVLLVALADWWVGNTVSLSVLYILPMILGAVFLEPAETAGLALVCASLRARFDVPSSYPETVLRFAFSSLAYFCSGLFVTALVRNREMVVEHLAKLQREQALRREVEEQLSVLVESSPAAILTLDQHGVVQAANRAANTLFDMSPGTTLQGKSIEPYLPVLSDALRLETGAEAFRTAAQCQGRRHGGEIFLAHTWFSSYLAPGGTRLAAIVVDSSEEMREREEHNLRQLMKYNRIAAAGLSHEVRNLCSSISLVSDSLRDKHGLSLDEDYQGLSTLVKGLERLASFDLHSRVHDNFQEITLQSVLDQLRIMIEPDWQEVEGTVIWGVQPETITVVADPQGLLQACLNLTQNSRRAVEESEVRVLRVNVSSGASSVLVFFEDSGPGVAAPETLFQPFQDGAEGTGLGLYISRAIVRSYGGDLRYVPRPSGCCFVIEFPRVPARVVRE